jgi:solute carrier family 10 (sodium/bile acid cotransporter), member 7
MVNPRQAGTEFCITAGVFFMWLAGSLRRFHPDRFVLSLAAVVLVATVLPCRGTVADAVHVMGLCAIASLFFLQGARLSRDAVVGGITHWRLHATIGSVTFILFPLTGWCLVTLFPHLLPQTLWLGMMFLCALPSTVQSSIALTSMAQGNVAGAICSATASNVFGLALTPLILAVLSRRHGAGIAVHNVEQVVLELLVPFAVGHLLRPWIGGWAERNRKVLAITDRGSILLVVYASFSVAVVNGVWHELPTVTLVVLGAVTVLLLVIVLGAILVASRVQGFAVPDEIAAVLCGSQKSLVSGVPIASALFPGPTIGMILIPMMIYYPMQLVVCAWLARRYASQRTSVLGWFTVRDASIADSLPGHV